MGEGPAGDITTEITVQCKYPSHEHQTGKQKSTYMETATLIKTQKINSQQMFYLNNNAHIFR